MRINWKTVKQEKNRIDRPILFLWLEIWVCWVGGWGWSGGWVCFWKDTHHIVSRRLGRVFTFTLPFLFGLHFQSRAREFLTVNGKFSQPLNETTSLRVKISTSYMDILQANNLPQCNKATQNFWQIIFREVHLKNSKSKTSTHTLKKKNDIYTSHLWENIKGKGLKLIIL